MLQDVNFRETNRGVLQAPLLYPAKLFCRSRILGTNTQVKALDFELRPTVRSHRLDQRRQVIRYRFRGANGTIGFSNDFEPAVFAFFSTL